MALEDQEFFVTQNSIYFLDPIELRYFRMPRAGTTEQAVRSDRLHYSRWHHLKNVDPPYWLDRGCLRIMETSSTFGIITSPIIHQGRAEDYTE